MAVAVTGSPIVKHNTIATVTSNAATVDVDGSAEVFTITPTKRRGVIIIGGTGSSADGDITFSIAGGVHWAGAAITGTVTKNTEKMIEVDTAKVKSSAKTLLLTLTPAGTDKLLTNHAAYVKFIELV